MGKNLCEFEHNGKKYVALVRKLTENECYRLMGVEDCDIDKLLESPMAMSSHYKCAGNSIVVDVLYQIFRKLFINRGSDDGVRSLFDDGANDNVIEYTHDNPLRVVTLCSGYDSQCLAFERLKRDYPQFDYELVAWSEFDPTSKTPLEKQPAVVAHNTLFPQWSDRNLGDMTKIDWEKVPDFDMLFYSTPCQSISQAGLQHGFEEGSGTRSSIIWNVRDALRVKKPKYACLENVSAMVNKRFLPMYNMWKKEVHNIGYTNYDERLNARDYDVPQNRDRIFLMSVRDDIDKIYYFPKRMELKRTLFDMLDVSVDTKYYLNPIKVDKFVNENLEMIKKFIDDGDDEIEILPDYLKDFIANEEENEDNTI